MARIRCSGGIAIPDSSAHLSGVSQAYESLAAELHDAFQDSLGPSPELPLMEEFLAQHPGPALEIGCGSGRLLLPLRQRGHHIEGLELSAEMATMAAARAAKMEVKATIHQADMDHWQPKLRYGALLAPAFTLQLASDPSSTLRHWRDWLEPGGGLYLSVFIPYGELTGELPEKVWHEDHEAVLADGRRARLETRHHFEGDELLLVRDHRYHIEGSAQPPYECRQTIHWAETRQWLYWLEQAGFEAGPPWLDWDPQHTDPDAGPDDFEGILTFTARRRNESN